MNEEHQASEEIKTQVPIKCPDCSSEIIVTLNFRISAPVVEGTHTTRQLDEVRQGLIKRLASIQNPMLRRNTILEINNSGAHITPEMADIIYDNIKSQDDNSSEGKAE